MINRAIRYTWMCVVVCVIVSIVATGGCDKSRQHTGGESPVSGHGSASARDMTLRAETVHGTLLWSFGEPGWSIGDISMGDAESVSILCEHSDGRMFSIGINTWGFQNSKWRINNAQAELVQTVHTQQCAFKVLRSPKGTIGVTEDDLWLGLAPIGPADVDHPSQWEKAVPLRVLETFRWTRDGCLVKTRALSGCRY